MNKKIKHNEDSGKNTPQQPDVNRERAEQRRVLQTELQTVQYTLVEEMKKGLPEGAIPCTFDFQPSFLHAESGVNQLVTLNVDTLTKESCVLSEQSKPKNDLPSQALQVDPVEPTEKIGCGCASGTSPAMFGLLPFLALIGWRRNGVKS